jgi:hypothetical protein
MLGGWQRCFAHRKGRGAAGCPGAVTGRREASQAITLLRVTLAMALIAQGGCYTGKTVSKRRCLCSGFVQAAVGNSRPKKKRALGSEPRALFLRMPYLLLALLLALATLTTNTTPGTNKIINAKIPPKRKDALTSKSMLAIISRTPPIKEMSFFLLDVIFSSITFFIKEYRYESSVTHSRDWSRA